MKDDLDFCGHELARLSPLLGPVALEVICRKSFVAIWRKRRLECLWYPSEHRNCCAASHIDCGALGHRHPLEFADTILSGVNTGQIVGEIGCRGAVHRCPEEGFNLHGPAACGF
jgi:hypothetical protein